MSTSPGRIEFTRTLLAPSSIAATWHTWSIPALPGPYAPNHGCTFELAIDEMPTIEPAPALAMTAPACLIVSIVPVMLRSMVRRHASVSIIVIGPSVSDPPAHATTPSTVPVAAAVRDGGRDLLLVGDVGDHVTDGGLAGRGARIWSTAPSRRSSYRPQIVTCAPSRANRIAQPRPMPLPPPVTRVAAPSRPPLGTEVMRGRLR